MRQIAEADARSSEYELRQERDRREVAEKTVEAQAAEIDELVDKKFGGSLPSFVAAFTRNRILSQDEISEIFAMLDGKEGK